MAQMNLLVCACILLWHVAICTTSDYCIMYHIVAGKNTRTKSYLLAQPAQMTADIEHTGSMALNGHPHAYIHSLTRTLGRLTTMLSVCTEIGVGVRAVSSLITRHYLFRRKALGTRLGCVRLCCTMQQYQHCSATLYDNEQWLQIAGNLTQRIHLLSSTRSSGY